MNALMIYPLIPPDDFWSFKYIMKLVWKKSAYPPLGALTVLAMLPKKWKKRLVDLNVEKLTDKDIVWADYVFISAMTVQKESAIEIIKRCKAMGKMIVAGGPLFTTGYEKPEFKLIDHFVLNEAEITLPKFLKDLEKKDLKKVYRSNKDEYANLSQTPIPFWEAANLKKYVSVSVQPSRGCPFYCEFCEIIELFGRNTRTKIPSQFIAELQALYKIGWRGGVFFSDDNLFGNKEKVKKMLKEIIVWQREKNYPFTFTTEISINVADDKEFLQLAVDANFTKFFIGLESPNKKSLVACNKTQNNRDIPEAIKTIHSYGIQVMGGFILGFDDDDKSIFRQMIEFVQELGIVIAMVGPLIAPPETRLAKRLEKERRLLGESTGTTNVAGINFEPKKMTRDELIAGFRKVVRKINSGKMYYKRIKIFLKNYKPNSQKTRISWNDVAIFVRSIFYMSLFSRSRFRYWWLIISVIFSNKAKVLPIVIEQAISREHLGKVAEKS